MKEIIKTQTLLQKLDEEITKLAQVRELLADAGVSAVLKEVFGSTEPHDQSRSASCKLEEPRLQGAIMRAAYKCVHGLDEPFTKADLADRMRSAGQILENPKTQLHYAMQRFIAEKIVKVVEEGGGKRPTKYQRVANRPDNMEDNQRIQIDSTATSAELRFRGTLLRTAHRCVEGMSEPFSSQDLVQSMRAAEYTFVGDAGLSAQRAIAKFINVGLLKIVGRTDDQQTILYGRRKSAVNGAEATSVPE